MYCQKCGENLPDDSKFCGYCGATLETTSLPHAVQARQEEPHYAPQTKGKKGEKAFKMIAGIAVIVVLGVILFIKPGIVPCLLEKKTGGQIILMGGEQKEPLDGLSLSTEERPSIDDFKWYLENVEKNGVPDSVTKEKTFDNLVGSWKCLFIYDPGGTDTGRLYDFLNLTLSGAEGNGSIILDWSHMYAGDQSIDETTMEDTVLNMDYSDGTLYGYGAVNLSINQFYSYDGAQYAIGTLILSDGSNGLVAMKRP